MLLGTQMVLELTLISIITTEFGAAQAAIYFTTYAQIALWNLIFTSGFQDFLIVTRLAGAKRYLRVSIICLTMGSLIALAAIEVSYLFGLIISTAVVLSAKWISSLIRISDRVFGAISLEAATAIIIKASLIFYLVWYSADALDLVRLAYFASVMPGLMLAIVGLIYCHVNQLSSAQKLNEDVLGYSMITNLYSLKMTGQLYRKVDVLIVDAFFSPEAVTVYAIIKQLISASHKLTGKVFAQVAMVQAKLSENNKEGSRSILKINFFISAMAMTCIATAIFFGLLLIELPKTDQFATIVTENGYLYLAVFVNFLVLTRANLFTQVLKAWGMADRLLPYTLALTFLQLSSLTISSLLLNSIVIAVWVNTFVSAAYFLPVMKKLYDDNAK